MEELDLYFYQVLAALENEKSKRSYNERTIFDFKGKKMRRKLEKGYYAGVKSAIKVLKKVKKEFDLKYAVEEVENKERAFIQQIR